MDSDLNVDCASIIPNKRMGQMLRRTRLAGNGIQNVIFLAIFLVVFIGQSHEALLQIITLPRSTMEA
jgi:hypothetical protein